jgi:pimeloyl-ACP methyl ester carboxylesterase
MAVERTVLSGGVRLAVHDHGGTGRPVVLLHGLAGHSGEWDATAAWMSERHRVIAVDQRGQGASERHPADVSRAAYTADVIAVIEDPRTQEEAGDGARGGVSPLRRSPATRGAPGDRAQKMSRRGGRHRWPFRLGGQTALRAFARGAVGAHGRRNGGSGQRSSNMVRPAEMDIPARPGVIGRDEDGRSPRPPYAARPAHGLQTPTGPARWRRFPGAGARRGETPLRPVAWILGRVRSGRVRLRPSAVDRRPEPVVLLGQSLGGHTAMLVAAARPDLVRALVMVEASPGLPDADGVAEIGRWLASWPVPFPSPAGAARFFGGGAAGSGWAAGLEERQDGWWPRFDPALMLRSLTGASPRSFWREWQQVACPTLVVLAESGIIPSVDVREMARTRPDTVLRRIPGAGHDVHLEAPDLLRSAIEDFLETL